MKYALIDADGIVENVIIWDGKSEWSPDEGLTLVKLDAEDPIGPGDRITKKGSLVEKAEPETEPVDRQGVIDVLKTLLVEKGVLTEEDAALLDNATVNGVAVEP